MKLLIDSNIILDLFDAHRPDVADSIVILDYCQIGLLKGYFATFSIPTIIYILRKKYRSAEDQQFIINSILCSLTPAETTSSDLIYPFQHHFRDYENGLQAAAAERIGADFIITHNLKDFQNSSIPAITPSNFIERITASK